MTTYARIVAGQAVDTTTGTPADLFHADVASQFVIVPDGTSDGDQIGNNGIWTKRAPMAEPAVVAPSLPTLTPMTFYLAFTPTERIAIKSSSDAMVKEFWASYELAVQLQKDIDPNLKSVSESVAYLAQGPGDTPAGPGILASRERIAQVLAGLPQ